MSLHRRKFIQLGSVTLAGIPFSKYAKAEWYGPDEIIENATADELFSLFKSPNAQARPFVRWWWNGLRVVKEELIRELDLLKNLGIGGVEINSIAFPAFADPLQYKPVNWLSDEWLDLLKATVDAAKERGLICDIIVGSGWPFGGEFLSKEEQTQMMALGTKNLTGPKQYIFNRKELEKEVNPPVASVNPKKYQELAYLRLAPAKADSFTPGVIPNAKVTDDKLMIDVPAGDHVLYYLVKNTGFENVIHGAPGASGPVLNHYNKAAVEKYLNRMSDAINKKMGSMKGTFRSLFSDSFELEGANWCDDMVIEFKKRRGYDPEPYLPFILFKVIGHAFLADEVYGTKFSAAAQEEINNVRYDFETTRLELFNERFYQTYLEWCRRNGVGSRMQAYGMELHPVEGAMQLDYPEGESWIKPDVGEVFPDFDQLEGRANRPVNKLVSSGAHLAGKKLIGCEEATNTQMVFQEDLQRLKITGDQSMLSGTNHSIFHGFNYSPPDAPFPGWVRYGTFINERNTLWPYFPAWISYKARLSALFQQAEMVADIAVLHPFTDVWKGFGTDWYPRPQKPRPDYVFNVWEAIHQNGSGCDCISENIIQKAKFSKGQMTYGSRNYKYLILVEVESMLPQTAAALVKFAAAGGKIICIEKWPSRSAGLKNYEADSNSVSAAVEAIKQKYPEGIVLHPAPRKEEKITEWYYNLQSQHGLKPYVEIWNPVSFVSQIHYQTSELAIFFFANQSSTERHLLTASFDIKDKTAYLWDPEWAERYLYPPALNSNIFRIELGPAESKLIVLENRKGGNYYQPVSYGPGQVIDGPWNLTLNHTDGSVKTLVLDKLVDFKADKGLSSFAGTVVYDTEITIKKHGADLHLDLGKVFGVTELIVNGKPAGMRWYGQPVFPLKGLLQKGKNKISIRLTTTIGNYMKSLTENPTAMNWTKTRPLYSQGLIGPVILGYN